MQLEAKIFLLAVLKKEENETLKEVLYKLVNTHLFTIKEGKKLLKMLQEEEYILEEQLSFKGITIAQATEAEFKL